MLEFYAGPWVVIEPVLSPSFPLEAFTIPIAW